MPGQVYNIRVQLPRGCYNSRSNGSFVGLQLHPLLRVHPYNNCEAKAQESLNRIKEQSSNFVVCVVEQVNVTDPSKPPLEFGFMLNSTHTCQKKCQKVPGTGLGLDLQVYYYESPYNQGQLTEVPLNFKLIAIKVVGQTIQVCSTTKMSKLQQNGIIKLGLINFLSYTAISPPRNVNVQTQAGYWLSNQFSLH